jgi:hypothetical protein
MKYLVKSLLFFVLALAPMALTAEVGSEAAHKTESAVDSVEQKSKAAWDSTVNYAHKAWDSSKEIANKAWDQAKIGWDRTKQGARALTAKFKEWLAEKQNKKHIDSELKV